MPRPSRADKRRERRESPKPASGFALHGDATIGPREARIETWIAGALIAVVGVVLVALALGPHKVGDYFTETDFYGDYAHGARMIQHGRLIATRYGVIGPVYEIALALAGFVVRDLFLAAKLLSVAGAVTSLGGWSALLARRAGTRVALGGLLFMATNGFFLRYGHSATTDTLANALSALALLLFLAARGDRAALAAGLLAALCFLTRYNTIAILPAGLAAILLGGSLHERRLRAAALALGGFLLLVLPWVLYSLAHGAAFSFQLHHNIAYEVFAHARGITWDDYQRTLQPQFRDLWQVVARDPPAVLGRMAFNVVDHLRQDARNLLGIPAGICAAIGVLVALAGRRGRGLWPVWLAGALLFLTLVPAAYSERYALAMLPMYATLAGLPFAAERYALAFGPRRDRWLKPALALLPLSFGVQRAVVGHQRFFDQLPVEVLPCADSLRAHMAPGDRVMARKPHVAAIAGAESAPLPFTTDLPGLAAAARQDGVRWIFISWPEAESRPQYGFLLDTAAVVPGLVVRARTGHHPAVLYEIGPGFGTLPSWWANDTLRSMYNARSQLLIDGSNTGALFALGNIERVYGRYERARALLVRDAALEPKNLRLFLMLGDVALRLDDADLAAQSFEHAMLIDPSSAQARFGRGWASRIAGRDAEAASWWRPLIELARDAATLQEMVEVFHATGDREAESAARAALAKRGGAK